MLVDTNLDHKRANYAYECVKKVKESAGSEKEKSYHSAVRSSGSLIQAAGLMQTLSFYISKKEKINKKEKKKHGKQSNYDYFSHYELLAEHILKWILFDGDTKIKLPQMYEELLDCKEDQILYHTQETKAFIIWLKRFSDSMLESGG